MTPVSEFLASELVSRIVTTLVPFVCVTSLTGNADFVYVLIYTTVKPGKKMQALIHSNVALHIVYSRMAGFSNIQLLPTLYIYIYAVFV
jgi:hypothetical protein